MGGGQARFVRLTLGATLVQRLAMPRDMAEVRVALMFGTGEDAGKVAVQVDTQGDFVAKFSGVSKGRSITLSAATCEGLFALTPGLTFDVAAVPVRVAERQPPLAVIALGAAALAED